MDAADVEEPVTQASPRAGKTTLIQLLQGTRSGGTHVLLACTHREKSTQENIQPLAYSVFSAFHGRMPDRPAASAVQVIFPWIPSLPTVASNSSRIRATSTGNLSWSSMATASSMSNSRPLPVRVLFRESPDHPNGSFDQGRGSLDSWPNYRMSQCT